MNSRLYAGTVLHDRKGRVSNRFRYGLYFAYLDLAELAQLDEGLKRFSYNRAGLISFQDRDHGPCDGSPLRPWIDERLSEVGVDLAGGAVRLLAFPRVLGFKFYPVSFWYCFHTDGDCRAVLAEVHNTFGDGHNYLLHNGGQPLDWSVRPTVAKAMHVSPFVGMEATYEFRLSEPTETLRLSIHDHIVGEPPLLVAAIDLKASELTDASLMNAVSRMGPMSARAWMLIHLQAIRIVSKGGQYHPRPAPTRGGTTSWPS